MANIVTNDNRVSSLVVSNLQKKGFIVHRMSYFEHRNLFFSNNYQHITNKLNFILYLISQTTKELVQALEKVNLTIINRMIIIITYVGHNHSPNASF